MAKTIVVVLLALAAVACGGQTAVPRVQRARSARHVDGTKPAHASEPACGAGPASEAGQADQLGRLGRDPPGGGLVCHAPSPPRGAATAMVVWVIDGDTVVLRTGGGRRERVRLIGVDAPETWLRHDCFGAEATRALRRLTPPGSRVRTVPDVEHRDRFGRLLLYLWTPQGDFVNAALVQAGYARTMIVPPDTSHASTLRDAERTARRTASGLWRACG